MTRNPRESFAAPLASMLGTQMAAAMALAAVPVLAPEIAAEAELEPSLVGVFVGVCFAAAMLGSAVGGALIARVGPVRTNQLALLASGAAVLVAVVPTAPALVLCALLLGAGYGPNTPSGSQVLARTVPPRRRGLAFSLKQSGAPLGAMLAGVVLPAAAALAGWRGALVVVLVIAVVAALLAQPLRRRVDLDESGAAAITSTTSTMDSLRLVWRNAALRRVTVGAFALMVVHGCYQTFLVVYLVDAIGLGLATAGAVYAVLQGAAAVSRIALGWLVDRVGDARRTLVAVAGVALASSLAVAAFSPGWPVALMAATCLAAGVGSSGWYGVFLAELVRLAPEGEAGTATGGALFFVFVALVAGPLAISCVVALAGSYGPAFIMVAALAGVSALAFRRGDSRAAS